MNRFILFFVVLILAAGNALAAPPGAFVAHYEVLRSGQRIGEASMTLARHASAWQLMTDTRGTSGLAGLLGVDTGETSLFRWRGDMPEMLQYDYRLASGLKNASRRMRVDWSAGSVHVDDSRKGRSRFDAQPGLVERHLLTLALAQALRSGEHDIVLPVAVRDRVESEHFTVNGPESVQVPAGHFDDALRVQRDDRDRGLTAWYAPSHYPIPLKLTQGGKLELRLSSFTAEPAAD